MSSRSTYYLENQVHKTLFSLALLHFPSSEYTDHYVPHRAEVYSSARRPNIPRIYTTAIDRSNSFQKHLNARSVSDCTRRPPTTPDPMEIDHVCSPRRNTNVPRAYFYLGAMANQMRKKLPHLTESTNLSSSLTASTDQFPSHEPTMSVES